MFAKLRYPMSAIPIEVYFLMYLRSIRVSHVWRIYSNVKRILPVISNAAHPTRATIEHMSMPQLRPTIKDVHYSSFGEFVGLWQHC